MSPGSAIHLAVDDVGPAVADVQHRLRALGLSIGLDTVGSFGRGTRTALEAFQYRRGLRVDGVCGPQTWSALVEAGRQLGDRFLYRRTPMLRGDDVAELQQRLSALGFDTGRVDGIFGDLTSAGLGDFQRNVGLPVDGIAGASTVAELIRCGSRHGGTELVSSVRTGNYSARRREPWPVAGWPSAKRAASTPPSAPSGGCWSGGVRWSPPITIPTAPSRLPRPTPVGRSLCRLRLDVSKRHCSTGYYAGYRYSSPGGRRLAELFQSSLPAKLGVADAGSHGMSLPVLHETQMPAVICEVGPASLVVEHTPTLARAIVDALTDWVDTPWRPTSGPS